MKAQSPMKAKSPMKAMKATHSGEFEEILPERKTNHDYVIIQDVHQGYGKVTVSWINFKSFNVLSLAIDRQIVFSHESPTIVV